MDFQKNINNNNINENINLNEELKENPIQINNNNFNSHTPNKRYNEPFDTTIFHKKKKDYNIFNISPEVEEIPTFTFENDRNLKSYKGKINSQYSLIEQYSKNYLEYMKKFENRRKTPFSSPFMVYQEKTKGNNNNIFNQYDKNVNNFQENQNRTIDANSYSNPVRENQMLRNSYDNNNLINEVNINQNFKLQNNASANNIFPHSENFLNFSSRSGEITNPDYFFQRNNKDYYKYRLEQKKYLDYNYEIIKNRMNKKNKREPDINPYNPINEKPFEKGKSDLLHNPILNPINNYSYNKYLEKEVNLGKKFRNPNSNDINNFNKRNNYNFSPLKNAGNQLLNS